MIEAYLPLARRTGDVGIVEYYRDAGSLQRVLTDFELIVWAAAALSGLVVIAAIFGAATQATRKIETQTSELQHLSVTASLGQMTAGAAHSFRNPLASIRSSVERLQVTHQGLVDDTVAEAIGKIDRIDRHVRELFDLAGSDQGQASHVELTPPVSGALDRIAARADRSGVFLDRQAPHKDMRVPVVPPLFPQAQGNVMTNAVEAMPIGGRITISAVQRKGEVCLSLIDHGTGFPEAMIGAAPVPFAATNLRGPGLGLAMSERRLCRFRARLEVANTPAIGGCVKILLKAG